MKNAQFSARRALVSTVAAVAVGAGGMVALAEPATAAYAPTAGLSNYSPRRCSTDVVHASNFPRRHSISVYTVNRHRRVPLARSRTDARGAATIRFRVPCRLTLGLHPLVVSAGSKRVVLAIHVRRAR